MADSSLAIQVVAAGGRWVGDYGAFQWLDVPVLTPELAADPRVEVRDSAYWLELNAARLDTRLPEAQALRAETEAFEGSRLHLVQFVGPIQPAWRAALLSAGVRIVGYVPHHAYLVYGGASGLSQMRRWASSSTVVQWDGSYADSYKIHPGARRVDGEGRPRVVGTDLFAIQLVADSDANPASMELLERRKLDPLYRCDRALGYVNVVVRLAPETLEEVASCPDVVSIQPYFPRGKHCERQGQIVAGNLSGSVPAGRGYLEWLASRGFTAGQFAASAFAVDLTDSGIDNGTTSPNHPGLRVGGQAGNPSRLVYSRLEGSPHLGSTLAGCDGHGTMDAHILGGCNAFSGFPHADSAGFRYGLGVCPFVALGSSVIFDPDYFTFPSSADLQSRAYQSGARISNNSWGGSGDGSYDIDSQNYDALVRDAQPAESACAADGNQEMVIVFSVGNAGPGAQTVSPPGTAKNVLSIGASENVQAFGSADGSKVTDAEADNATDIPAFSGRGPCADGRHKPDLVAPGTHVSGGVIQGASPGDIGTADPCFHGRGISGGPSDSAEHPFFPAGQQFYTASSGTSQAAPCVSGGCALLRQHFLNRGAAPPSPAMTKAFLVNAATYLTGLYANDTLWSDSQGMGRLDLGRAFDGTARVLRDQLPEDLLTASGQTRTYTGYVADPSKPFRVTLAWTDAPGSTLAAAYNNDLDLTVTIGQVTYKGNVFAGSNSAAGGVADGLNNCENVFLPPGFNGTYSVRVTAANINSDGVPGNAHALDQDFALVIYNADAAPVPRIEGAGCALVSETCLATNGVIDPGETVTVALTLENVGSAATTNLTATLLGDDGVLCPGPPQTYGALPATGTPASRLFTLTANGVCGGTITARFQLRDGPTDLGQVTWVLPLGRVSTRTVFNENFDAAVAPALSSGWTSTVSGAASNWTTSAALRVSAPNAAFAAEPAFPGASELISPEISIVSPTAQLSFDHAFSTECDTNAVWLGYDGGVLEIRIGDGAFVDLSSAGGSFVIGGYTRTLEPGSSNPLSGRKAWSGESGGFTKVRVNLPSAAAGQRIQVRWRFGTDTGNYYGGSGWFLDNIVITDTVCEGCGSAGPPCVTQVGIAGAWPAITWNTVTGLTYTLEYKNALADPEWLPAAGSVPGTGSLLSLQDTNRLTGASRFYRVRAQR